MSRQDPMLRLLDKVERWDSLDGVASVLTSAIKPVTESRRGRNLLTGVSLGHPLHPALAQLSLGLFTAAGFLDLRGRPADSPVTNTLIAAGLVSSVPTVAAGLADWSYGHEQQQRTGLFHAAANTAGLLFFAGSLLGRRRGLLNRAAALVGLTSMSGAAYVGGHLAFRQALGANHTEHVPHRLPTGWAELCRIDEVPERGLVQRLLGDQPLVAFRVDGRILVLSDVCPHLAGPLHEGELRDGCLVCPWHGSAFRVTDGSVYSGPATAPAPALEVHVDDGKVLVRLPGAG